MLMFRCRFEVTENWKGVFAEPKLLSGSWNSNIRYNVFIYNGLTKCDKKEAIIIWRLYNKSDFKLIQTNDDDGCLQVPLDRTDLMPIITGLKSTDWLYLGYRAKTDGSNQVGAWLEICGLMIPMPVS